jgi:hypothetical protein
VSQNLAPILFLASQVAKLSDFGAAFRYATLFRAESSVESSADFNLGVFETIEVRAFACLIDDLLGMIATGTDADATGADADATDDAAATGAALRALRDECWREDAPAERPRFAQIALRLQQLARMPM